MDINTLNADQVAHQLARYEAQRAANLSRWSDADVSDSALSERANGAGIGMMEMRAEVIRNGGAPAWVLVDNATGAVVAASPVQTQFGWRWAVKDVSKSFHTIWMPFRPARESTLGKRGYREERRMLPAIVTCSSTFVPMVLQGPCTIEQANAAPVVP